MMILSRLCKTVLTVSLLSSVLGLSVAEAAEVNVYSARKEELIKPLLDNFTKKTGITVNLLTADADQLIERLKSEGSNSPADLLITTDAGRLYRADHEGLFQPIDSAILEKNIPARYRDPKKHWVGLSLRARVIFYSKQRVKPSDLSTYEDLADPKWKGRICVRSSNNVYNQSLLASIIAAHGVEGAEKWAKGIVDNMARKPQGGDRDQITAIASGQCDIAIVNTYYYGQMLESDKPEDKAAAQKVALFWPNQKDRGAHINISGAGILTSAKNKPQAITLLEYLSADEAQHVYAEDNMEYPVKPGVEWSPLMRSWGQFKADDLAISALGDNQPEAIKIFDRVGWR